MFGYLVADPGLLTEEELARYRGCYCGLCRCLKERHGEAARLALTYDMTFLTLLLSSLYEPEETAGEGTCLPHPISPRAWWRSEAADYTADLNVILAYLKCLDDWEDDGRLAALAESRLFKASCERAAARWPRQYAAVERGLETLGRLEKERVEDADAAAESFGELMGELLAWREDRWREPLYNMGRALGRFLYVMDACMDLDADTIRNRYNPFRRYYGLPDNEQRFGDILRMLLGECLYWFDKLPLVQDAALLKNILCAGLWTQFNKRFKKEERDGTGPV
ncbi:MAG: hypothetical protein IKO83_04135 [Oscillospiraceae bacterium]|nr:hypothetical protein [Oscillospiraceae bacterium]